MPRQSFRGAGGAGAVVLPYERSSAAESAVTALARASRAADRRIEGALAIVASGVLVAVAIFVASWTFAG